MTDRRYLVDAAKVSRAVNTRTGHVNQGDVMGRIAKAISRQAGAGVRHLILIGTALACGVSVDATAEDTDFIAV